MFGIKGQAGSKIVLTHKLKNLPTLKLPSLILALQHKISIPTHKNTASAIHKLLTIHRPNSVEQFLEAVGLLATEGGFANKIMILYALGLTVIPLQGTVKSNRPEITSNPIIYSLTLNPNHKPNECTSFQFQFISSVPQSKQQCLAGAWAIVTASLARYGVSYLEKSEKVADLRYNNPIFEGGVQLPSALRLTTEGEMTLTYAYEGSLEGIQLEQYFRLTQLVSSKDQRYQFWRLMEELASALQNQIKKESNEDRFYGGLAIDNIYVVESGKLAVEVNVPALRMAEWREKELPELMRKVNWTPNSTEMTFISVDRWSVAVILLEVIAIRSGIGCFRRQLQESLIQKKASAYLSDFMEYLKAERYVVEGPLLRRVKSWLKLDEEDDYIQFNHFIEEEEDEINNFSLVQFSEAVYNNQGFREDEKLHLESIVPSKKIVSKVQRPFQKPALMANKIQGMNLSISQILQHLQAIKKRQNFNTYVAKKLTESEMDELYSRIIQDFTFFQTMDFKLEQRTTRKDKCPECLNISNIYVNSCGHGKCEGCFLPLIEIAATDTQSAFPFKIKCDVPKCNQNLCHSLLKPILQNNPSHKRSYCQLLLKLYANTRSTLYLYCHQKKCSSSLTIYHNNYSRVLLCENCKNAACTDCHSNCHKPLTCEQFKSLKEEISKSVIAKLKDIKLLDESSVQDDERKLMKAGLGDGMLKNSYLMVTEWLVLLACQSKYPKSSNNLDMQSDFLEILTEKVANILREIHRYCKDGAQGTTECVMHCIQLQQIDSRRGDILAFVYSA